MKDGRVRVARGKKRIYCESGIERVLPRGRNADSLFNAFYRLPGKYSIKASLHYCLSDGDTSLMLHYVAISRTCSLEMTEIFFSVILVVPLHLPLCILFLLDTVVSLCFFFIYYFPQIANTRNYSKLGSAQEMLFPVLIRNSTKLVHYFPLFAAVTSRQLHGNLNFKAHSCAIPVHHAQREKSHVPFFNPFCSQQSFRTSRVASRLRHVTVDSTHPRSYEFSLRYLMKTHLDSHAVYFFYWNHTRKKKKKKKRKKEKISVNGTRRICLSLT